MHIHSSQYNYISTRVNTYRLLYGRGVPLGHIGTVVAYMAIQCQYDLEAHLGHIITFLLHPRKLFYFFNQ